MTGSVLISMINPVEGAAYQVELLQNSSGGHAVTWPGDVVWAGGVAPTITTTADRKDIFTFVHNGTNFIGAVFAQDLDDTV